jgi:hypothetical protein
VQGFHELIPADLVNVFDERELELLIGGIADIDVDDWKKHTDYRGYTESDPVVQNFWKVCETNDRSNLQCEHNANTCNYRSFVAGTPSRSPASCNSPLVLRVSPSTASKISKVPTDPVASRSRSPAKRRNSPSRIRASIVWICLRTSLSTSSRKSSHGLSRRRSASDRSKRAKTTACGAEKKAGFVGISKHHFPCCRRACVYVRDAGRMARAIDSKTNRMEKTRNIVSHFPLKHGGHSFPFLHFYILSLGWGFLFSGDNSKQCMLAHIHHVCSQWG